MKNRSHPVLQTIHQRKVSSKKHISAAFILAITASPILPDAFSQEASSLGAREWDCRSVDGAWVCDGVASSTPQNANTREAEAATRRSLGWVPLEQLSLEQRAAVPDRCCGAYIPPPALVVKGAQADLSPERAATQLEYNLLEGDLQTRYELKGDIRITQGNRRVTAEQAEVDEIANTITVTEDIHLYEPGLLVLGDEARINRETGEAIIDDGQFLLYESRTRGSAGLISRAGNQILTLTDGTFTQCEPGQEHWALRGSTITINPVTNRGVARHARVDLGGVPVFYWPYLSFPLGGERQSGFLFPTITSDDLAVPYYLNLAPNYDMTLTPRYVADRGAMLEAEFRHLSPWFETVLGGAFLSNGEDDISDNEQEAIEDDLITEAEALEFAGEDRWLVSVQQIGGREQDWYSAIDYTKVSDVAYFNHLDTTNLDVNRATHLRQAGEVGYLFPNWDINAQVVEYQPISLDGEEPYQQKPAVNIDGSYRWESISLALNNQFTRFDHGELFLDADAPTPTQRRITGDRARFDYELAWEKEWLWGFFRPAALLKSISYRLDEAALKPDAETDPAITVPQAALDMGLFFERDGSWFGNSYLQTFEPRLFYFYSDFESHDALIDITPDNQDVDFDTSELTFSYSQLFRTTRFAGGDRIDDDNRVSVGLTTRFLDTGNGAERLSVSVGQTFYQQDRRVTLTGGPPPESVFRARLLGLDTLTGAPLPENRSEMAGQLSAQLTDSLRFSSDVLYGHENNKVNKGNATFRYLDEENRIFNIGYRYERKLPSIFDGQPVDQTRKQGDVSLAWPVSDNWSVVGRRYYDFTNERELDTIAGLEYTGCCYRFRVVWRRWLDNDLIDRVSDPTVELEYDEGVFFELQLRGLGGVGSTKIRKALSEGIYNFNRREEALLGRPID